MAARIYCNQYFGGKPYNIHFILHVHSDTKLIVKVPLGKWFSINSKFTWRHARMGKCCKKLCSTLLVGPNCHPGLWCENSSQFFFFFFWGGGGNTKCLRSHLYHRIWEMSLTCLPAALCDPNSMTSHAPVLHQSRYACNKKLQKVNNKNQIHSKSCHFFLWLQWNRKFTIFLFSFPP